MLRSPQVTWFSLLPALEVSSTLPLLGFLYSCLCSSAMAPQNVVFSLGFLGFGFFGVEVGVSRREFTLFSVQPRQFGSL